MTSGTLLFDEMRLLGKPSALDIRPLIRAESFRMTEGEPMTVRRAKAFAAVLDEATPFLYTADRLAGSARCVFRATKAPSDEDMALLTRIGERNFWTHSDHVIIDFPRLLRLGVSGIREGIARRLDGSDALSGSQRSELTAMDIAMAAASRLLARYGEAAKEEAATASGDEAVRWMTMAAACAALAERAPRSFREAIQLAWFAHHILSLEGRYADGLGRLDQYLAPFYRADLAAGVVTPEGALDLLTHLWAKIGECQTVYGADDVVNIAIGGWTPTGEDGTNDLSYLCLAATRALRIPGPNLSARFHPATPERFYQECIETISTGVGYPALFNDAVIVAALEEIGYPSEAARDYAPVGCIETFLPGLQPPWSDSRFNLPKCLELTLGNGRDLRTGELRGPETGPPSGFASFDDLLGALDTQIRHMARQHAEQFRHYNRTLTPEEYTSPFLSALMTDCVERGRDINNGGTRYAENHGVAGMGIGTVTDSLAAIRQGVFEERRFSMEELLAALRANFAGYENLQAWAWHRAPKYGNDDPAVDELAAWVVELFCDATLAERTYGGGWFLPLIAANISNIYAGVETAATPDGRRAGAPLSDAGSPTYGQDTHGPAALVHSVTKPNWKRVVGGSVINQKFHPAALAGAENRTKVAALLKSYFALGGEEMQINVVREEDLREAMAHPEQHGNLIVRVSGFSARFTDLASYIQADILARTTHEGL